MSKATHITQLTAENVMRLEAVSIEPDPNGNLIVVGGRNGAGKTSVLNSIAMALGGRKLCPDRPIKTGETKASVKVMLDNGLVVERRFTPKGDYLHVSGGDGQKISKPQAILDELTGTLTFDPLQFVRMAPIDRAETLHGIVDVDVSSFDTQREKLYGERRDTNRALRDTEGALEDSPEPEGDVPDNFTDIAQLVKELEEAQAVNAKAADLNSAAESKARQLEIWTEQQSQAEALLKQRQRELTEAQEHAEAAKRHVAEGQKEHQQAVRDAEAAPTRDTAELRTRIHMADEANNVLRAKKIRVAQVERAKELQKESDGLTKSIDRLDAKKAQALAEADYPIEGLVLTPEGSVVYNGVPFEQASQSEQLRVSLAIGLALNPTLRVMLIRDGSLLDPDGLADVARMAAEADAQVWLERVGEGQECSVVIEEGRVKE